MSNGSQIRAKVETIHEIKCNTQLFKNIEKSRQSQNVIECLVDENSKEITNHDEILKYMDTFYTRLYSSTNEKGRNIDEFLNRKLEKS